MLKLPAALRKTGRSSGRARDGEKYEMPFGWRWCAAMLVRRYAGVRSAALDPVRVAPARVDPPRWIPGCLASPMITDYSSQ